MLEHYNVSRWTEGIDLERSTLRDQIKKPISHLGGLETKKLVERMREGVPKEEEDIGGAALLSLESLVAGEKSLGRKNRRRLRLGERGI
jgi:hypothetical protein